MAKKINYERRRKINKIILTTFGITFAGLFGIAACAPEAPKEPTKAPIEATQEIHPEDIKPGTSEYVDAIYYYVKEEPGMISKVNKAWEWTKANYPNYHKDEKTMETAIFYGNILSRFGADEDIKKVGDDLVQATKYVYRGYKTVDSDHTKINLEQINKGIEKVVNN